PYGTTVTLETVPAEGYRFAGWSGDLTGTTHPLDVFMDSNKTLNANFELRQYALIVESENGRVIKTPDALCYPHGTTVTLEAVPNYGYHFCGWSGDVPNGTDLSNPIEVVLESTRTLTAHFTHNQYPLTVLAEHGSVTAAPDQPLYEHGTPVTLQATPCEGYHFTGWSGDVTSPDNPLQLTMDSTQTLTAHFEINTYPLTLEAENGTVTAEPDLPLYPHGTPVTLEATPAPGYHFIGWSGDATGATNPLQITLKSATAITARFALNEYTLTVDATNGSVTQNPDSPTYDHGTLVTLEAIPAEGYTFSGWSGDVPVGQESTQPLEITMDASKVLTAHFERLQYPLTVQAENGTVETDPNQSLYPSGTTVTLRALPATGFHFVGWSGDASGAVNPLLITLNAPKTVVANFARNEYALTILAQNGTVAKSPDQATYAHGTVVTLTANPAEGYEFEGWSGDASGATNPLVVLMDSTRTLTASFIAVETEPEAWYAIRYSDCTFEENTLEPGSLLFRGASLSSSVCIQLLKKATNCADIPGKVAYRKLRTVPLVRIEGDMRIFQSAVSIEKLEATGYLQNLTGQDASIALVEAGSLGKVKLSALKNSLPPDAATPEYASTALYTSGEKMAKSGKKKEANTAKVCIQLSGVILTDFSLNQPVACVKVESRKYLADLPSGSRQKRLSLGGIGPVVRVAAEAVGQTAPQTPQDSIL
ncbi:MAG TPA: InlB B-repeat-containing protein, partial [Candidatus Sumerlaeota bacterium]|nr:InlB B-repeat-containing protein [Candidatus Sumerlaeota bacterium]